MIAQNNIRIGPVVAIAGLLAASCGARLPEGPEKYRGPVEQVEPSSGPKYQCANAGGSDDPYLVEWDGTTKGAKVEGPAKSGVLLVKYESCTGGQGATANLEVLDGCEIKPDSIDEPPYTPMNNAKKTETEKIKNEGDIYAKLKIGALELLNDYNRGERWSLDYVVSDTKKAFVSQVHLTSLKGRCAEATHFVEMLALGAYRLHRTARVRTDGKLEVFEQGGGYDYGGSALNVRTDGMYGECLRDSRAFENRNCQAVVRVFLKPIAGRKPPKATPLPKQVATPRTDTWRLGQAKTEAQAKTEVEWVYSKPAKLYFTKTEVTMAQYWACMTDEACTAPASGTYCNRDKPDRDNHPVNCIDWSQARAVCKWLKGRLPTEDEWYAEASNGGKWDWPWGDGPEVSCEYAVWGNGADIDGCGWDSTRPVCSKLKGNSISGLCDMSGNVWEWTSTKREKRSQVMRGGSWNWDLQFALRSSGREKSLSRQHHSFGVRCVRASR